MSRNSAKTGGIVAGWGCLFGLAPLIVSALAAAIGSNIGNTLHWYTLFTAPVGAVVVVIGLVVAIVGTTKSTPEDFVSSISPSQAPTETDTAAVEGTGAAPIVLPPLPQALAQSVKLAYAIGFGVLLVSCGMRVTLFQPMSGILTFFDVIPALFSGWFVYQARNAQDGLQFLRLHRSQMIVSIAGCVAGLFPLVLIGENIAMLSDPEIDSFQWGGTIITGIIPFVASVASLVFASVARARYRASFAKD